MTSLYRHYDAAGELLYVGISLFPIARLQQHLGQAHWASEIVRVEIENHPSIAAARQAEWNAIMRERPIHNVAGKPKKKRPPDWTDWGVKHPTWWIEMGEWPQDEPKFIAIWCGHIAAAGCLDAPL